MAVSGGSWLQPNGSGLPPESLQHRRGRVTITGQQPPPCTPGRSEYHHISADGNTKQHIGNVYNTSHHYPAREQHPDEALKRQQRDEALRKAASEGQAPRVRRFLDLHADLDHVDPHNGYTALHHAALGGFTEIVRTLLAAGADVSARSNSNETALHIAALKGYTDISHVLLRYLADVHVNANAVGSPLHCAIFHGDIGVCKALLERGASVHDRAHLNYDHMRITCPGAEDFAGSQMTFDCYPIDVAIDRGNYKAVELLLDSGSSTEFPCARWMPAVGPRRLTTWEINSTGTRQFLNGVRPVLRASCLDNPAILKLLLDRGADMYHGDHNGMTAAMYAAVTGQAACLSELLGRPLESHSRHSGRRVTYSSIYIVRRRMYFMRTCHDGFSALDLAKYRSHEECANLLSAFLWPEAQQVAAENATVQGQ